MRQRRPRCSPHKLEYIKKGLKTKIRNYLLNACSFNQTINATSNYIKKVPSNESKTLSDTDFVTVFSTEKKMIFCILMNMHAITGKKINQACNVDWCEPFKSKSISLLTPKLSDKISELLEQLDSVFIRKRNSIKNYVKGHNSYNTINTKVNMKNKNCCNCTHRNQ